MKKWFQEEDGSAVIEVNTRLYSVQTIHSAGYVFMDKAYVRLEERGRDKVSVLLTPKAKGADLQQLAMDFSQEMLSYAHYFSSLKINAESLKLLLQRALFSASPGLVKEAEEKEIEDLIKELEAEEKKTAKKKK